MAPKVKAKPLPAASPHLFSVGVLRRIGAPVTKNNVHNFSLWLGNEQNTGSWSTNYLNPLGVEVGGKVLPMTSFANAISITANTLLSNPAYKGVVTSFRRNAPTRTTSAAIVNSPWNGSAHYGGLSKFLSAAPLTTAPSPGAMNVNGKPSTWQPPTINPIGGIGTSGIGYQAYKDGPAVGKSLVSGVTSVGGLIGDLTNPTKLHDVGLFAAGAALAVVGIAILLSQSKTASLAKAVALK